MKLSIFNKTFDLAISHGFNYDYEDIELHEVEDIYYEALEFLFDCLEPIKLDSSDIHGNKEGVVIQLPLDEVSVSGEFEFDKEREVFKHIAQDIDGQIYLIEWSI
jgi:hypothetical protein